MHVLLQPEEARSLLDGLVSTEQVIVGAVVLALLAFFGLRRLWVAGHAAANQDRP